MPDQKAIRKIEHRLPSQRLEKPIDENKIQKNRQNGGKRASPFGIEPASQGNRHDNQNWRFEGGKCENVQNHEPSYNPRLEARAGSFRDTFCKGGCWLF